MTKIQHFLVAEILGLCWFSDYFIDVALDFSGLKDDSSYLVFYAVVNFYYLSDQGYPRIKSKDFLVLFLDL